MTAAIFCYFFTFLLKNGVQKRVPPNRLIIRKTHFMGGTLKNRGHILWFFTRDSWVGHTSSCPSQKSLFFRTNEPDGHWFCEARGRNRRFAQKWATLSCQPIPSRKMKKFKSRINYTTINFIFNFRMQNNSGGSSETGSDGQAVLYSNQRALLSVFHLI